eukprot:15440779-Alexandrium_andersonii.AAC.1
MVEQLSDALEQAGVASQPRAATYSLLVERQVADASGQAIAGQTRTRPIQRADEWVRDLGGSQRVCTAYSHGFVEAQVAILSEVVQTAGPGGQPPSPVAEAQLRRLLECPSERAMTSEVLEAGLQTWQGRLRPGEAAAIPVAAGG